MSRTALLALVCLLACSVALPATPEHGSAADAEMRAAVPALDGFHETIVRIWHEAWPDKNVALLAELAPDVARGVAAIDAATLPGILRERQAAWTEAKGAMKAAASSYAEAAAAKDGARLLAAAEVLHTRFEQLVRAIRPALPELDAFHVVLYRAYHREKPAGDTAALRRSAAEMKDRFAGLAKATLPARLAAKSPAFDTARTRLAESVAAMNALPPTAAPDAVLAALERLHTDYQAVEKVFD